MDLTGLPLDQTKLFILDRDKNLLSIDESERIGPFKVRGAKALIPRGDL